MAKTNRDINKIEDASQKPLWKRGNPSQVVNSNPVKDAKKPTSFPKPALKPSGLNK